MALIACVLKSGGVYRPAHVTWLKAMVTQYVSVPHRFVCLSDVAIAGVETLPLRDSLPGWWSKLELFREFDECFFLDLDTVIVGDITDMVVHAHTFTALHDRSPRFKGRMGSGIMAWRGDYSALYHTFIERPDHWIVNGKRPQCWGDQGFIQTHVGEWTGFQDLWPGALRSFKLDLKQGEPTTSTRIVYFHGKPKPWEVRKSWIPQVA